MYTDFVRTKFLIICSNMQNPKREVGDNVDPIRMQQGNGRKIAQRDQVTDEGRWDEEYEGEYDDIWPTRMPSSSRRYQGLADVRAETGRRAADAQSMPAQGYARTASERTTIPPRRTATQTSIPVTPRQRSIQTDAVEPRRHSEPLRVDSGRRFHWLVFVGLAMFIMILGWIALSAFASWWQTTQDDWRYGRPRTYQVDAVVGHNDSPANQSHFIAMNMNRHIVIIEIPGGNVAKSVVFSGPTLLGPGQDLTPVTLTFKDVNGDGNLDMVVNVQDSHFVFLNKNGTFVPAPPDLNVQG